MEVTQKLEISLFKQRKNVLHYCRKTKLDIKKLKETVARYFNYISFDTFMIFVC